MENYTKDFFICHASEDKIKYALPICNALSKEGCWLDLYEIKLGDNIVEKIQEGINNSRYALLLLTENWLKKEWTRLEFSSFLCKQMSTKATTVIPIMIADKNLILKELPLLAPISSLPYTTIDDVVYELKKLIGSDKPKSLPNVCMISSEYPPRIVGGLGIHVTELSNAMANLGMEVSVVLPCNPSNYNIINDNVNILPLAKTDAFYNRPVSWLTFALYAAKKVCNFKVKPDIIHCHDWVTVLAGILIKCKLKIPLVYHIHLPNKRPLCSSVENLGLLFADLITVNSEYISEEIVGRQIKTRTIKVIKNGVDTELFKPSQEPESDYILFVGRLVQQKGIDVLLKAFWVVLRKFPEVKLKIVGTGELEGYLKQLSINLMIHNNVSFEGLKQGRDLVEVYQKSLMVIVPSIYEPFGMTAIEAMACKKAVIATDYMGLKENITHGKTGYLFGKEDYLDLAQWIMNLLADPEKRSELSVKGYQHVIEDGYQWPIIAEEFNIEYINLLGKELYFPSNTLVENYKEQIIRLAKTYPSELPGDQNKFFNDIFNFGI